jgi:putative transposase
MDNYTPSTPCIPLPAAGLRELIRGRLFAAEGASTECRSQLQPRYQRRTRRVNEAIVGCYLAGANSRRIRRALAPLLGTESLSKSAISRLVQTLKTHFEAWQAVIAG